MENSSLISTEPGLVDDLLQPKSPIAPPETDESVDPVGQQINFAFESQAVSSDQVWLAETPSPTANHETTFAVNASLSTGSDLLTGIKADATLVNTALFEQPLLEAVPSLGDILLIQGNEDETVHLRFSWIEREAAFSNEIGVFLLEDAAGRVSGIAPDEEGYAQAALTHPSRQTLFASGKSAGAWKELTFQRGDRLGFYLIQNSTHEQWLATNPQNELGKGPLAFFSVDGVNPDDFDHVQGQALGEDSWQLAWEDLTGGGDRDFDDVVFTVEKAHFLTPGLAEQPIEGNFEWVSSEAAYRNEMGFYWVDDASGRIGDLMPGDDGYAEAALSADRRTTLFNSGQSGDIAKAIEVPGNQYFGWYLVQNDTTEAFLAQNPDNALHHGPVAFFSYADANPDGINHLKSLGNNTYGWEDLTGGGDLDYNDFIFRYDFEALNISPQPILPELTINDLLVEEGDEGTGEAVFTVSLSQASDTAISVAFQTVEDTALAGLDFEEIQGLLTFAPGETTKTVRVPILWDLQAEPDEAFILKLSQSLNATIVDDEGIATIIDNDVSSIPLIVAALRNDTGVSSTDGVTTDPTISGTVSDNEPIVMLKAGFNNTAVEDFVDVTNSLQDNAFLLDAATLSLIHGGTLPDGEYRLKLQAIDAAGDASAIYELPFVLDRSIQAPILALAPSHDTGEIADGETGLSKVVLTGQTEANVLVELQGTDRVTTSDAEGNFSFSGITLTPGENDFAVTVTDAAGNQASGDTGILKTALPPLSNTAPVITSLPTTEFTISENDYQYQITASDADGDFLTYNLINGPEGGVLDSETGILIWDTASIVPGTHDFTVQVSDGKGGVATQKFSLEAKLPLGTIQGTVWEDINGDGIQNIDTSKTHNVTIAGTDAIFLAGRSDITIPALGESGTSFPLLRHNYVRQDFLQETRPVAITVNPGDIFKFSADGQIDFFNGSTDPIAPDGYGLLSNLQGVGQIGGYSGPRGALIGVFLNEESDSDTNLEAIDFSEQGLGTDFTSLAPDLGQTFFIGDGLSNGENLQEFSTPEGATHLYLGLADGFSFSGTPGYYEDNDGAYNVTVHQESQPESGQPGVSVYLDSNDDGIFNPDEPRQVTDVDGNYEFTELNPGNYVVRQQVPNRFEQTFPTALSTEFFIDEIFKEDDWTSSVFIRDESTSVEILEQSKQSGSSPEEYRRMNHTWGNGGSAIVYHKYEDFTYDPGIHGGIDNIDYSEDQIIFNGIGTIGRGLAVFQDEDIFRTEISGFGNRNWQKWVLEDLQPEDFVSDLTGNNPDFSALGAPIQFGYVRSNFISGRTVTMEHGIDNWAVSLQSLGASSHIVSLSSGEAVSDINFGNRQQDGLPDQGDGSQVNQAPVFTSTPPQIAQIDQPFQYQAIASDFENDALTYSLLSAPEGMTIDASGLLSWQPTSSDIGDVNISILVTDSAGNAVQQAFGLSVQEPFIDTEAPTLEIGSSNFIFNPGETLDLQVRGTDNVGITDLNLSFDDTDLPLSPGTIVNGQINTTQVELTEPGLYTVTATAADAAGNIGTETTEIRVVDPTDQTIPEIDIDLTGINEGVPITTPYDIFGTIDDPNLEFYRIEYAPARLVDLNNLGADDPDYILLSEGTKAVEDDVLATIDPRFLENDNYVFRVIAQDVSGNTGFSAFVSGVATENKVGNFTLDATDLNIPLTGIPITINRRYDTLQANFEGDLGFGWELTGMDAQISEGVPVNPGSTAFTEIPFKQGTRVFLNNPDGERIGFTFEPEIAGVSFFGTRWRPRFVPDPGVEEELTVDYTELIQLSDGTYGSFLFGIPYNPSVYNLTTKDGLTYTYDQFEGLQTVSDRNNNVLTYTDEGIFSSTGESVRFNRDEQGRIASIIDPTGNGVTYSYDADGNLVGVTDRAGNTTQYVYDPNRPHYLVEEINPLGVSSIRTEYDDQGRLTRIIDAEGNALDLNIDFEGPTDTQTIRDPLGNATTLVYDESGNVIQQIDAESGITAYTYDADNNLTSITDPRSNKTSYTYDDRGNRLTETDALGNTTTTTYNEFNQVTSVTDSKGNVVTNRYDASGNLLEREDAAGNITQYAYSADGNLQEVVDAAGNVTSYGYDRLGRLNAVEDAAGGVTQFAYDNAGNLTSITTPEGNTTRFGYDAEGQLIQVTDAKGNITQIQYNAAGDRTAVIDALGRRTEYDYNSRGLETEVRYADGTVSQTFYDALDRVIREVDQNGNATKFEYDGLDRLIAVTDALGSVTQYDYDGSGNLITQTDALGRSTRFDYDAVNQLIGTELPLGQVETRTYDPLGNLASLTNFNGETLTYEYDPNNLLQAVRLPDAPDELYTYTPTGEIATITDGHGVTQYEYDALDQLIQRIDPEGAFIRYGYDLDGNIETLTTPSGTVTYEYDAAGLLETVTDRQGSQTTYGYDPVGNLITTAFANGVTETRAYDLLNRLILMENTDSDGNIISSYEYTLDNVGNRLSREENTGRLVNYTYDDLYRLIQEAITDPANGDLTTDYVYDDVGNRLSRTSTADGITTYIYDDNDRLLTEATAGIVTEYSYDDAGNLITKATDGEVEAAYTWNSQGELIGATVKDGAANQVVEYQYNADGIRISSIVDGQVTRFLIDETQQEYAQVIEEFTPSGIVNVSYIHGNDLISQEIGSDSYFYHTDGLGSSQLLTDKNGSVINEYVYDSYGQLLNQTEAVTDDFLYTGESFDSTLGSYYLRARYYDPGIGRFLSRDPFEGFKSEPLSLNKYNYVESNPSNLVDPSGLFAISYGRMLSDVTGGKNPIKSAFQGKATPTTGEIFGSLVGYIQGFSLTNLIFFGELLGAINNGGTLTENKSTILSNTKQKLDEVKTGLTRVRSVDVNGFAGGFINGVRGRVELANEPLRRIIYYSGKNASVSTNDLFGPNGGGFVQGSQDGLHYVRNRFPS